MTLQEVKVILSIMHEQMRFESDTTMTTEMEQHINNELVALCIAISALEKQIPKKIKKIERTASNGRTISDNMQYNSQSNDFDKKSVPKYRECTYTYYLCPICGALTKDGVPDFCWNCGQALDWSDTQ